MVIKKRKGFTLTELLVAVALSGLIILAVSSVDISSRRFFEAIKEKVQIQAEAAMAMEHIVKNLQLGIGDINNLGFSISGGNSQIQVWQDTNGNSMRDVGDTSVIYQYAAAQRRIRYKPDPSPWENLTEAIIYDCKFYIDGASNRVSVIITARSEPTQPVGPDNPETILTSSIALRAMSSN